MKKPFQENPVDFLHQKKLLFGNPYKQKEMGRQHNYFVYIITNPNKTVLYTGVTNDLLTRLRQHYENRGKKESFAGRYFCYNLLYYERFRYIQHAIDREKEIKRLSRKEKEELIAEHNPSWEFIEIKE